MCRGSSSGGASCVTSLHRCHHPRGRLLHRLLPGLVQLPAVRRPQRNPEHAGTSVNLTAVGYEGLADSYVTVQQLITASDGVLTPSNVHTKTLPAAQWLSFLTTAIGTQQSALNCGDDTRARRCTAYPALSRWTSAGRRRPSSASSSRSTGPVTEPNCTGRKSVGAGLVGEPRCAADADHRSRAGQRHQRDQRPIRPRHHRCLRGHAQPATHSAAPDRLWPGRKTTATTAQVNADLQLNLGAGGGTLDIPLVGPRPPRPYLGHLHRTEQFVRIGGDECQRHHRDRCGDSGRHDAVELVHRRCPQYSSGVRHGYLRRQPRPSRTTRTLPPSGPPPNLRLQRATGTGRVATLLTSTLPPVLGSDSQRGRSLGWRCGRG